MRKLTKKEIQIMEIFWNKGPLFVRELLEFYDEPRPHFNTISTQVRTLEKDGFLDHHAVGGSFQYYPIVEEKEYGKRSIASVVRNYFDNSYLNAVSAFVKEEKISVEDLKDLIKQIENSDRQ